jgi:hypothetical protein
MTGKISSYRDRVNWRRNHQGNCPEVHDPVICSNGVVYSNACFAGLACATGCVPYGVTE